MLIATGDVPRESAPGPGWIIGAWFCGSYCVPLQPPEAGIPGVFVAVSGLYPAELRSPLLTSGAIAKGQL